MALEGDEFGKARSIFLPLPNLPVHRKGRFWTGFLNVNPGGAAPVLLCLFALFLVLAPA